MNRYLTSFCAAFAGVCDREFRLGDALPRVHLHLFEGVQRQYQPDEQF